MADSKNTKPKKTIDELLGWVKQRGETAKKNLASAVSKPLSKLEQTQEQPLVPVPLPITCTCTWTDAQRCLPNEIVRSALFNARNRNLARENLKNVEIAVIGDGYITYRGEELRQDDAMVWMQMIHWAKDLPFGTLIEFTAYAFCKAVKWPICNGSYERLRNSLGRMQATALAVHSTRLNLKSGVSMSMIPFFEWKDTGKILKRYQVQLAPQLVALFDDMQYTQVEWAQRLALPDGLATWLHTYFASHKVPFPISLDAIKKGSGMMTEKPKHVRQTVEGALTKLVDVGFLVHWEISDDLVHVIRA